MSLTNINFYRRDDGATEVTVSVTVHRAGKLDVNDINRVIAILDGGEPETSRDTGGEPVQAETSRRSRRAADDKRDTDTSAEANPTQGRRSRRPNGTASPKTPPATSESSESSTNGGATSTPEPTPARRRRQQPEAPAGISDADLTKAASEGARVIGPEFVTAWLTEFGVGEVSKLAQDVRREFIDGISDEIEKKAA